jgi:hypothetical protein
MIWTDDQIQTLRRMFSAGHNDNEIGREIGVTGRAVNGKRYRLHLMREVVDGYEAAIRRAERARRAALPDPDRAPVDPGPSAARPVAGYRSARA